MKHFSEVRDGMKIEWDAPIVMSDGTVLRCDIFRPDDTKRYPAILSYGPCGKGLLFKEGYPKQWRKLVDALPEVQGCTSGRYFNRESVDPERWVPDGWACVRVDSRGAGNSEGIMDLLSPVEGQDLYECIEWAASQPWCDGKVAMSGSLFFATNQWVVASKCPPHLAACIMWEGAVDYYREYGRSGGILRDMGTHWLANYVYTMQHGTGDRGPKNRVTGENLCGNHTLTPKELDANRVDHHHFNLEHEFFDREMQSRLPDVSRIRVPFLSTVNWGGAPLHPRGNFEGFINAGSRDKFLEAHGDVHLGHFYSKYGVALQKQFLDFYVKGKDNGWDRRPGRVQLQIRHVDRFVERFEDDWPIPRTRWEKWFFTPEGGLTRAKRNAAATLTYDPKGDGLTFLSEPFTGEVEFTGPMACKLFISSESVDADLFLVLRLFATDMAEVVRQGLDDPKTPIAMGWLRASHRRLDVARSLPYRPYHTHERREPLQPGQVYELDIELHPTSVVVPQGYRIGLSVRGRDYVYGVLKDKLDPLYPLRIPVEVGSAMLTHSDPTDRPFDIFGGNVTVHFGEAMNPYVLLPMIPEKEFE